MTPEGFHMSSVNNILMSASILSTYWEQNRRDTLDLLMPFLKASIAETTAVGSLIDVDKVAQHFREEYGYSDIPINVIYTMLNRLSPQNIKRIKGHYSLNSSFDGDLDSFLKKKASIKERREKVVKALKDHLSSSITTQSFEDQQVTDLLLDFFSDNGLIIYKNVDHLVGIKQKDGKINYEIARFIINESKKQSSVFDSIIEMVKGFFVSTAISFQAENTSVAEAKFKNFSCYIDTRIIINALGLHLPEAKHSALEFLTMLKENGADLYCFKHNYEEISDVIKAYRHGLENPYDSKPFNTLEGFDEQAYSISDVSRFLSLLRQKNESIGIIVLDELEPIDTSDASLFIDEKGLADTLKTSLRYNQRSIETAVESDVSSVAAIVRLRNGKKTSEIEKAGHLFVSMNVNYCIAVARFLRIGEDQVPPVISDINLSSIVWLKSYASHKDYPRSKLIENAMAAIEPSPAFLSAFYDKIDKLTFEGGITADEAAIIRADLYSKREAMRIAQGDSSSITNDTIFALRDRVKKQYLGEENNKAGENYKKYVQEREKQEKSVRNAINIIEECGAAEFNHVFNRMKKWAIVGFSILTLAVICCLIFGLKTSDGIAVVFGIVIAAFNVWNAIDFLWGKRKWVIRYITKKATAAADRVKDKKREEFEQILGRLI